MPNEPNLLESLRSCIPVFLEQLGTVLAQFVTALGVVKP